MCVGWLHCALGGETGRGCSQKIIALKKKRWSQISEMEQLYCRTLSDERQARKAETTLIMERVELKPSATMTSPVRLKRQHCGTKTHTYATPAGAGTQPSCGNTHSSTVPKHIRGLEVLFSLLGGLIVLLGQIFSSVFTSVRIIFTEACKTSVYVTTGIEYITHLHSCIHSTLFCCIFCDYLYSCAFRYTFGYRSVCSTIYAHQP